MSSDPSCPDLAQAWSLLVDAGLVSGPAEPHHPIVQPTPSCRDDAPLMGWTSTTRLQATSAWAALADAYAAHLGTPHRAVGAACALQHYTGKLATAVLGLWAQTGGVCDLSTERWDVLLDEAGRSQSVRADLVLSESNVPLRQAISCIQEHADPMVWAAQQAGSITERLAWGSVAASCAGALARVQRALPTADSGRLCAQATTVLDGATWGTGRALVSCRTIAGSHGPRLVNERHTCCLIRLGRDGSVCGTCPQQPPPARRVHQAQVAALPAAHRLLAAGFSA